MRIYKRENIWYIDYTYQGKRCRKRVGKSQRLAELALRDIELKILKKEHLGIDDCPQIEFNALSKKYLEYSKVNKAPNTYCLNINNFKHLIEFFKDICISEIKANDVEMYKVERLKYVSSSSVNRDLAVLHNFFNKAIEWGYLDANPMKGVKLLKEPPGRLRFLSKEEILRLLENMPAKTRTIVVFAMNTGMRKSEILNLKWSDVNLTNRTITLDKTKTNERRIIPINDTVYRELVSINSDNNEGLVFGNQKVNLRRCFTDGLRKAGIKDFCFHDLRHTFASHLAMSGVNINVIQQLLGHKSIKMTLRYSHLSQEHLQGAVNKLNLWKGE